jgi:hypothetical protein
MTIAVWLWSHATATTTPPPRSGHGSGVVAIDGETPRGAHPPDGHSRSVHLLAAMEHTSRVVLAASGMLAVGAG